MLVRAALLLLGSMIAAPLRVQASAPTATELSADLDTLIEKLRATHPDLERRHSRATWDAAFTDVRSRLDGMSTARFVLEVTRLVALAGDGHTRAEVEGTSVWRRTLPLRFRRHADGLFVIAAASEHAALVGQRVVRIGAREIAPLLVDVRRAMSGDNDEMSDALAPLALMTRDALDLLGAGSADAPIEIVTAAADGSLSTAILSEVVPGGPPFQAPAGWILAQPRIDPLPPSLRPHSPLRPYWFECLDDEWAVYFRYDAVADDPGEPFPAFVARLFRFIEENEIERLIIDLRGNDGGNNYLVQPLIHAVLRCDRINQAGHLFVLTGPGTFSAAVNCASDLERETRALFVGEPTGAGANHCGDASSFVLPRTRIAVRCSTVRWQKSDPHDSRTAILPDVPVPSLFSDWIAGRDAALEAALAFDPATAASFEAIPPISHWRRPSQERRR